MNKIQKTILIILSYTLLGISAVLIGKLAYRIYDSTKERTNCEYQFVVTDRSMTVYDGDRTVGTVPIEGQLDSLINLDNY